MIIKTVTQKEAKKWWHSCRSCQNLPIYVQLSTFANKKLNEAKDDVKTLFHKFIDEFDIDTTNIDVEQFFKENL